MQHSLKLKSNKNGITKIAVNVNRNDKKQYLSTCFEPSSIFEPGRMCSML
jgi:hypothetical protein